MGCILSKIYHKKKKHSLIYEEITEDLHVSFDSELESFVSSYIESKIPVLVKYPSIDACLDGYTEPIKHGTHRKILYTSDNFVLYKSFDSRYALIRIYHNETKFQMICISNNLNDIFDLKNGKYKIDG